MHNNALYILNYFNTLAFSFNCTKIILMMTISMNSRKFIV